jgi:hypothetical protein
MDACLAREALVVVVGGLVDVVDGEPPLRHVSVEAHRLPVVQCGSQ